MRLGRGALGRPLHPGRTRRGPFHRLLCKGHYASLARPAPPFARLVYQFPCPRGLTHYTLDLVRSGPLGPGWTWVDQASERGAAAQRSVVALGKVGGGMVAAGTPWMERATRAPTAQPAIHHRCEQWSRRHSTSGHPRARLASAAKRKPGPGQSAAPSARVPAPGRINHRYSDAGVEGEWIAHSREGRLPRASSARSSQKQIATHFARPERDVLQGAGFIGPAWPGPTACPAPVGNLVLFAIPVHRVPSPTHSRALFDPGG